MFQQVMLSSASSHSRPHWPVGSAKRWPPARSAANSTARAQAEAQAAEGPRRHFGQRDLHRGPVEAPGERQRGEHPPQPARQVIRLGAQAAARSGSAFMPRRTIESIHSGSAAGELDAPPARQHRGQRHLALEPGERKAEADVRAEAEGEVRHAVAREVDAVRLVVGARVAIGGVHQQEHALAGLAAPCRAACAAPARCAPARRSGRRSAAAPRPRPAPAPDSRAASRSSSGKRSSARKPFARWCVVVS